MPPRLPATVPAAPLPKRAGWDGRVHQRSSSARPACSCSLGRRALQPPAPSPTPLAPAGTGILLAVTIIYQYWEQYNKEKAQMGAGLFG